MMPPRPPAAVDTIIIDESPGTPLPHLSPDAATTFLLDAMPSVTLHPHQLEGATRLWHTIHTWGGALLGDAVGSGKTYTAIATALLLEGEATVVCPAPLVPMWTETLNRLGLEWPVISDGLLSRRSVACTRSGLLIVDEAHRFRNQCRRRKHLQKLSGDREVLLITATPVWRSPTDLYSILTLAVGTRSLVQVCGGVARETLGAEGVLQLLAAVEAFVVRRSSVAAGGERLDEIVKVDGGVMEVVDVLRGAARSAMPGDGEPSALFEVGVLRALESSPVAARRMLQRAQRYLERALDAAEAGRQLTRGQWVREVGAMVLEAEQLVFPFWYEEGEPVDPDVIREAVTRVRRGVEALVGLGDAGEGKLSIVREMVEAHAGVLCFTEFSRTAFAVGRAMGREHRVLVVTGERSWHSGLGRLSRAAALRVLEAGENGPELMVLTPVGSEGLNLQRVADAIVHYDLPWTTGRLQQRDGRLLRLGGAERVRVVTLTQGVWTPPYSVGKSGGCTGSLAGWAGVRRSRWSDWEDSGSGQWELDLARAQDRAVPVGAVVYIDRRGRRWCRVQTIGSWVAAPAADLANLPNAVRIRLQELPNLPEEVQVKVLGAIASVEIAVRDAGGGIDKNVMQRVFALVRCGRVDDAKSELERAERRA